VLGFADYGAIPLHLRVSVRPRGNVATVYVAVGASRCHLTIVVGYPAHPRRPPTCSTVFWTDVLDMNNPSDWWLFKMWMVALDRLSFLCLRVCAPLWLLPGCCIDKQPLGNLSA
jgi:hypothetical protein